MKEKLENTITLALLLITSDEKIKTYITPYFL